MSKSTRSWVPGVAAVLLVAGCGAEPLPASGVAEQAVVTPDGRNGGLYSPTAQPREDLPTVAGAAQAAPEGSHVGVLSQGLTQAGINYHGGPVLLGTVNTYIIWYGGWNGNSATTILPAFLGSLGGSAWWNINTSYTNGAGTKISNSLKLAGQTSDAYSQGKALSDAQIQTIVATAIGNGSLPLDTNAIYFVLTSADVTETSGFCTQYCGWHDYGTISGANIKYAFVGNPDQCPNACEAQQSGPNGNAGADGMASIIAHEASEATTDPNLNAWYDRRGNEDADKCAWTFGTTHVAGNGSLYNITLGGKQYLIQRNWLNSGRGSCVMGL